MITLCCNFNCILWWELWVVISSCRKSSKYYTKCILGKTLQISKNCAHVICASSSIVEIFSQLLFHLSLLLQRLCPRVTIWPFWNYPLNLTILNELVKFQQKFEKFKKDCSILVNFLFKFGLNWTFFCFFAPFKFNWIWQPCFVLVIDEV